MDAPIYILFVVLDLLASTSHETQGKLEQWHLGQQVSLATDYYWFNAQVRYSWVKRNKKATAKWQKGSYHAYAPSMEALYGKHPNAA